MQPLVSIILTVYEINIEYLNTCLDSLLKQTYKNIEIILVNDCSPSINYDYVLKISPKIKLYTNQTNLGMNKTISKGFSLAKGKYIVRIGPDDYVDKSLIAKEVAILEKNKRIGTVCCNLQRFEQSTALITRPTTWDIRKILNGNLQGTGYDGGMMFRRSLLPKLAINMEHKVCVDFDLQMQLLRLMPIQTLPEYLYYYRINDLCISHSVQGSARKTIMKKIIDYHKRKLVIKKPKKEKYF